MPEVTIKAIEKLLDFKLEPINTKLDAISETVSIHTTMLDALAKDVKSLNEAKSVKERRADKHEEARKFTAEKIGISSQIKKIIEA